MSRLDYCPDAGAAERPNEIIKWRISKHFKSICFLNIFFKRFNFYILVKYIVLLVFTNTCRYVSIRCRFEKKIFFFKLKNKKLKCRHVMTRVILKKKFELPTNSCRRVFVNTRVKLLESNKNIYWDLIQK